MSRYNGGYQSAIQFILDREHFGIKLGLKNIARFLNEIGNPHNTFLSVHIAGTNGKGSTAAYIDSIMREAGYRVGIFTSPHLTDFRERIRVNGQEISKRFITNYIEKHRRTISKNKITFFEVCTALSFSYFASKKVNLAIVETGLGGRLDATSTLTPVLSIITDISFDHTNILGNTLRLIAHEKAGIIKQGVPILVGTMKPEPRKEILRVSRIKKAPVIYQKKYIFSRMNGLNHFNYSNDNLLLKNLISPLPGIHQMINASLAIRAIEILNQSGFSINKRIIRSGLKNTCWPGRFQIIKSKGKPDIILDVGHNQAGVKAMTVCFRQTYPGRKAHIIIGFVRYKNLDKTIRHIPPIARSITIARLNTPRSTDPKDIADIIGKRRFPIIVSESLSNSAREIIKSARNDDIIIICGSHFAVGEFMLSQKKIL